MAPDMYQPFMSKNMSGIMYHVSSAAHKCRMGRLLRLSAAILMLLTPALLEAQADRGGSLTYAEREAAGNLNPLVAVNSRAVTDRLFSMIYEPLFRYDYITEEYEPVLATSIEVSMGGRQATVSLRPGVQWHDGRPLTAADVVESYRFVLEGPPDRRARSGLRAVIATVERGPGDQQVRFAFQQPLREPQQFLDLWILPAHLLTVDGGQALASRPVGTGPFSFAGRNIQGNVDLEANTRRLNARPNLDRVGMRLSTDVDTMILQLLSDILDLVVDVPPDNLVRVESGLQHRLIPYQSYTIYTFAFNSEHPVLSNSAVRRALTLALNREQMLSQWYDGRGELLAGPVVPAAPFFNPNLRVLPFDRAEATRILDQEGVTDRNGDGSRQMPNSDDPLELRLLVPVSLQASESTEQNVAQDFVQAMAAIGIRVRTENVPVEEYQRRLFTSGDFDVAWVTWTFDPIYDISPQFHSRNAVSGGSNVTNYRNDTLDQLLDDYATEDDANSRRSLMYAIQGVLSRELPYAFLFTVDRHAAIHNSFAGVQVDPYYFFPRISEWYIMPEFR